MTCHGGGRRGLVANRPSKERPLQSHPCLGELLAPWGLERPSCRRPLAGSLHWPTADKLPTWWVGAGDFTSGLSIPEWSRGVPASLYNSELSPGGWRGGHHTAWATLSLSLPSFCREETPGSRDVGLTLLLTGLWLSHPEAQGFGFMCDV